MFGSPRTYVAGSEILRGGERPSESSLLLSGVCARLNGMMDGARSVTQLNLPGDFLDLHGLLTKQIDHGVVAISDCVTLPVSHADLSGVIDRHPHLARLLWLETTVDAAIQREWFHRLGRQDAFGRMAHLMSELDARLAHVGLGDPGGFDLPLTQSDFADCLGLSTVHVNRVLKELRVSGLLDWHGGRVEVLDREGLHRVAEFDPTYLRQVTAPV